MIIITDHSDVNGANEIVAKQFSVINNNNSVPMSLIGRIFVDKNGGAYRVTGTQNIRRGIINVEKVDPSCFKGQQVIKNGKQYTITNVTPSENGMIFECNTNENNE